MDADIDYDRHGATALPENVMEGWKHDMQTRDAMGGTLHDQTWELQEGATSQFSQLHEGANSQEDDDDGWISCHDSDEESSVSSIRDTINYSSRKANEVQFVRQDETSNVTKLRLHECSVCDEILMSRELLIAHERCHGLEHDVEPVLNGNTSADGSFLETIELDKPVRFQAQGVNVDFEDFPEKNRLNKPLESHVVVESRKMRSKHYSCHLCDKRFKTKLSVRQHLLSHTRKFPYLCHSCFRRFPSLERLSDHIAKCRADKVGLYSCDKCDMKFHQPGDWKSHQSLHEDEQKGDAPAGRDTNRSEKNTCDTVKSLRRSPGPPSPQNDNTAPDEIPLQCLFCNQRFSHKAAFRAHLEAYLKTPCQPVSKCLVIPGPGNPDSSQGKEGTHLGTDHTKPEQPMDLLPTFPDVQRETSKCSESASKQSLDAITRYSCQQEETESLMGTIEKDLPQSDKNAIKNLCTLVQTIQNNPIVSKGCLVPSAVPLKTNSLNYPGTPASAGQRTTITSSLANQQEHEIFCHVGDAKLQSSSCDQRASSSTVFKSMLDKPTPRSFHNMLNLKEKRLGTLASSMNKASMTTFIPENLDNSNTVQQINSPIISSSDSTGLPLKNVRHSSGKRVYTCPVCKHSYTNLKIHLWRAHGRSLGHQSCAQKLEESSSEDLHRNDATVAGWEETGALPVKSAEFGTPHEESQIGHKFCAEDKKDLGYNDSEGQGRASSEPKKQLMPTNCNSVESYGESISPGEEHRIDCSSTRIAGALHGQDATVQNVNAPCDLEGCRDEHPSREGTETRWSNNKQKTQAKKTLKPYACLMCGKTYSCPTYLRLHMNIHYGEKPFRCDTCTKRYATKRALQLHMELYEHQKSEGASTSSMASSPSVSSPEQVGESDGGGGACYSCQFCRKRFLLGHMLVMHLKAAHPLAEIQEWRIAKGTKRPLGTSQWRYMCRLCDDTFEFKCLLLQHMTDAHMRGRPYNCSLCHKVFNFKYKLIAHLRTHIK